MAIVMGIFYLFLLCLIILFFASFITSQYETKKTNIKKDPYSYLFDVYSK
ncbi:hypothetical protein ACFSUR_22895 [Halalkalibacter alkalisediminis]